MNQLTQPDGDRYYQRGLLASHLEPVPVKFFVLRALYEEPLHGYGVIKAVEEQTDGFCVPTEGAVYPILREFEECACATREEETRDGRRRKVYRLTQKGREAFECGVESVEGGRKAGRTHRRRARCAE